MHVFGITDAYTTEEVQLWLEANGFADSAAALSGMSGTELLAMSSAELQHIAPQGELIYTAMHVPPMTGDAFIVASMLEWLGHQG